MVKEIRGTGFVVRSGPVAAELPPVDLRTNLAGVEFPNPVFTASGCAAAGRELGQFLDVAALGGVVTKSIMLDPRSGRATPRMAETPSGMLNSIGLQGPGIEHFLDHDLPWLAERGARAVVSITSMFTVVLKTTNAITHSDCGIAGTIERIATAPMT